jgi:hypothetical protein
VAYQDDTHFRPLPPATHHLLHGSKIRCSQRRKFACDAAICEGQWRAKAYSDCDCGVPSGAVKGVSIENEIFFVV